MVLKRLVLGYYGNVAKALLGEYVEDFDDLEKDLKINFKYNWDGHVALEDLRIKSNLFEKLNLPFELKLGLIKKFDVSIPYYYASKPAVAKIDGIFLIVRPLPEKDWKMESQTDFDFKFGRIQQYLKRYLTEAKGKFLEKLDRMKQEMAEQASTGNQGDA